MCVFVCFKEICVCSHNVQDLILSVFIVSTVMCKSRDFRAKSILSSLRPNFCIMQGFNDDKKNVFLFYMAGAISHGHGNMAVVMLLGKATKGSPLSMSSVSVLTSVVLPLPLVHFQNVPIVI